MQRVRLGCAGWSYDDWKGGFYPSGTPANEMLERYARVFSYVEVNGTHYRAPTREQAQQWRDATPPGFQFSLKMPRAITHEAKLRGTDAAEEAFVDAIEPLRAAGKLAPVLAQFGPDFTRKNDAEAFDAFLARFPRDVPLAVELRNDSWWDEATYAALRRRDATLVWAFTQNGRTPPARTSGDVYLRLIGDRELTKFDRIQRSDNGEMAYWRARLAIEAQDALHVYLIANNHFLGFGPGTLLRLAEVLELPRPDLSAAARDKGQPSLGAFGS